MWTEICAFALYCVRDGWFLLNQSLLFLDYLKLYLCKTLFISL